MARSKPDAPTILLAEDSEAVRIILRMQLMILGYRVLEARNGAEAVEMGMKERPDLILMEHPAQDVEINRLHDGNRRIRPRAPPPPSQT
jgi:CheY-like chemotaxis protein